MGFYRLIILTMPPRLVRRLLGEHRGQAAAAPVGTLADPAALDAESRRRAAHIGELIRIAAEHTPWKSECYPQALTARTLLGLRRIPHTVCFGVRRDGGALRAHAWVRAGDIAVTGGTGESYTEVGSFSWRPGTRPGR